MAMNLRRDGMKLMPWEGQDLKNTAGSGMNILEKDLPSTLRGAAKSGERASITVRQPLRSAPAEGL
ncbi:hypothetical protein CERSUDRAFT_79491 [Gelatoporia subvermispora B]|uniref:Uncharacterized protein n=1 Tax=Ceriporiopsis subvermispora (strain B) TaxID=914234 RepID=M2RBQ0_CERS8|nr:hypothetical protein CERSUDRAFT_79491 [Gelatoporia subvermispora B]